MGLPGRASEQAWPDYDPARTRRDTVQIAVQVNGKLRATVEVARSASQQELEAAARDDQRVKKWIENKPVRRVIVVPGRLVNIVVG
jgi:leucyl-tRNA synthetase